MFHESTKQILKFVFVNKILRSRAEPSDNHKSLICSQNVEYDCNDEHFDVFCNPQNQYEPLANSFKTHGNKIKPYGNEFESFTTSVTHL